MPTTRRRHVVTETNDIAAALRDAAQIWPEDANRPGKLVVRLVQAGHQAIKDQKQDFVARRQAALQTASGALSGIYGTGYREALRDEWPE